MRVIGDLSGFAIGVWPVELSVAKRVVARHRVTMKVFEDPSIADVRSCVDAEGSQVLSADSAQLACLHAMASRERSAGRRRFSPL